MMKKKIIGVLASGRGSNLQAIMDKITDRYLNIDIGVIISDKADAVAITRGKNFGVSTCVLERKDFADKVSFEEAISQELSKHEVDLIVLAGFMRILGSGFVKRWQGKIVNIHPSLLPSFTGLNAHQQALDYGAKFSGCTVHFVDEGVDSGPIIMQSMVPIADDETAESLADKILHEEHKILPEVIKLWAEDSLIISGRRVTLKQ